MIDILLHFDTYLDSFIPIYGTWIYVILFLIIFAETGLILFPFLPGDSLLFAVGTLAARGLFDAHFLFALLSSAAILGDAMNYWFGYMIGPRIFRRNTGRFFRKEYLDYTKKFYEKYGKKTIFIARYLPVVRTFTPLIAGIGRMNYSQFTAYNILGGISWIGLFIYGGFFFGNIPIVKDNFSVVIMGIIIISILPVIIQFIRHRFMSHETSA